MTWTDTKRIMRQFLRLKIKDLPKGQKLVITLVTKANTMYSVIEALNILAAIQVLTW